jgi:D-hexose-6-phosphate mutarotase
MTTTGDVDERRLGRVAFLDAQNELPTLEITTPWSTAEVYMLGAHVTNFRKHGEPPLLFMSQFSRFDEGQPIRGGIPVIFPWFGPREGLPQHGFARVKTWELKEVIQSPEGGVTVRFRLPDCPEASAFPQHTAEYLVTVKDTLTLELSVTNNSPDEVFTFENCLHTYFEVSDATAITICGLKGVRYLDKVAKFAEFTEASNALRINSEVDRIYLDTPGAVEVHDPRLGRVISIQKEGSASTVVWNPWTLKAQQMPDFGNEEYCQMVCIESGNVAQNELKLAPGQTSALRVQLSTRTL